MALELATRRLASWTQGFASLSVWLPRCGVRRSRAPAPQASGPAPVTSPCKVSLLASLPRLTSSISHLRVIEGVGAKCVPPPCNSFQRFTLGPGSSSTLPRRLERGRAEDLYDVGVSLRSRPQTTPVGPRRVGFGSSRLACIPVESLAASRSLQRQN
jgi:hypothetical protein